MRWRQLRARLERESREQAIAERFAQLPTETLQKRLQEIKTRLSDIDREFPNWRLRRSGPVYSESRELEAEREYTILELSKRGELESIPESRPAQRLYPGLESIGDPIETNPFPADDLRHKVWEQATLAAEEELCRLNSTFLRNKPTGQVGFAAWMARNGPESAASDLAAWALGLCIGKFDIWAKRYVNVVWSEAAVKQFDQWLLTYAQAWLDAEVQAGNLTESALVNLKSRLAERVMWWKAEARRYLLEQKKVGADQSTPLCEGDMKKVTIADGASPPNEEGGNPRRTIEAFISKIEKLGRKITRKDIWTLAGYNDATEFERFQRGDSRTTQSAAAAFKRVLAMSSDEFIRSLEKKKTQT